MADAELDVIAFGVWNTENKFRWTPLAIAVGYRFGNFKPSAVTEATINAKTRQIY